MAESSKYPTEILSYEEAKAWAEANKPVEPIDQYVFWLEFTLSQDLLRRQAASRRELRISIAMMAVVLVIFVITIPSLFQ